MARSLAGDYVCPACRASLAGEAQALRCGQCGARYPVERDIPRFVPRENYSASFGLQWNRHARTQLDSAVGKPISETRLYETSGWPRAMPGARILECGSGAGRFTEILCRTGAEVYSFDYSSAVDANAGNNGGNANLHLFQGDIFAVPVPEASFDHVLCIGVLQHTPDPERAFRSLAKYVRPGGDLVIDVYRRSLAALLHWKYVLRPLTRAMSSEKLYRLVESAVPSLIGPTRMLKGIAGRVGARLSPIVEYSHLGLTPEQNREWAVLDTFDMYAPAYDRPQSAATVRRWYEQAGFVEVEAFNGYNGVVGRGKRPAS